MSTAKSPSTNISYIIWTDSVRRSIIYRRFLPFYITNPGDLGEMP